MTDPVSRSPDCAQVTVDLAALGRNYETMREKSGAAQAAAVIKADAYGLGMAEIVPKLLAMGCRSFFVALEKEGHAARALAPDADIYVLNGLPAGAAQNFAEAGLRPLLDFFGANHRMADLLPRAWRAPRMCVCRYRLQPAGA